MEGKFKLAVYELVMMIVVKNAIAIRRSGTRPTVKDCTEEYDWARSFFLTYFLLGLFLTLNFFMYLPAFGKDMLLY